MIIERRQSIGIASNKMGSALIVNASIFQSKTPKVNDEEICPRRFKIALRESSCDATR